MFQMALFLFKENTCAKLFWDMHKCRSYGPDKFNLWLFYHLTFMCDLDLHSTQTNVTSGTTTPQGEYLCKLILLSMHICTNYGPNKLNLWQFYHLTFKCKLDLQLTNVSNGTTTPQREHLCKLILKSMHKCRSYGPDKLIYVTFMCDLDL